MSKGRHKDVAWNLPLNDDGTARDGVVTNALLMDLRDELRLLNQRLACPNVTKAVHAIVRMDRRAARVSRR